MFLCAIICKHLLEKELSFLPSARIAFLHAFVLYLNITFLCCLPCVGRGWVDDLRFYVLFNSVLVISGRCGKVIMKSLVQWKRVYVWKEFLLQRL